MNTLMSHMCPSATRMIRMDHAHVKDLYCKIGPDIAPARREALTQQICTALELHAQVEEEIFYPALRNAGVEMELLEKSGPEHAQMRQLITRLRNVPASDPQQPQLLAELMQTVFHHVADEEALLLPAAEQAMASQLSELGVRMTERKMALAKPHMGQMALDMARGSPEKTAGMVLATLAAGALLVYGVRWNHQRTAARWH